MYERLVENWLDSASELSYQAPFCQMLAHNGYRILHSTRHSPIELGKDVVAIAPDGTTCAYQLKGNPGTRLTLKQLREIQPQLRELVHLALSGPGMPKGPHRSFLVTNGHVDEEARLAIQQMNEANARDGFPERNLEVMQRGDLLNMAKQLEASLWPTEITQTKLLLLTLTESGKDLFPFGRADRLLGHLLGLDGEKAPEWSAAEVRRRIASGAMLVSLLLKNYAEQRNHFAIASAWTMFAAYAIAACERFNISFKRNAKQSVDLATAATREALLDLTEEVLERKHLLEGDAYVDAMAYRGRYTLLLGTMSVVWAWCSREGWPESLDQDKLEKFLDDGNVHLDPWGEGAFPQLLAYYWYLRNTDARSLKVDGFLVSILNLTVRRPDPNQGAGLPSPYWTFEDVLRHRLSPVLGTEQDPLENEAVGFTSFYAESLLQLLVRTGSKPTCKLLWPELTRIRFSKFQPSARWGYGKWRTDHGQTVEVAPPFTMAWKDLVVASRHVDVNGVPQPLLDRPLLLLFFVLLFPHRGTPEVVRHLGHLLDPTWFLREGPIGS